MGSKVGLQPAACSAPRQRAFPPSTTPPMPSARGHGEVSNPATGGNKKDRSISHASTSLTRQRESGGFLEHVCRVLEVMPKLGMAPPHPCGLPTTGKSSIHTIRPGAHPLASSAVGLIVPSVGTPNVSVLVANGCLGRLMPRRMQRAVAGDADWRRPH